MPPKKSGTPFTSDANTAAGDAPTQKFIWEGANDLKLLLLTQGRYVKSDEYEKLASAFGAEASTGSIRNRISKLRVQQRNLYEGLGWEVPEGGAGHSSKKTAGGVGGTPKTPKTPKKRGASAEQGNEEGTPRKKGRAKKGVKMEVLDEDGGAEEEEEKKGMGGVSVKMETEVEVEDEET
ncbi:hypothetical protein NX059_001878 [Plenodomus lindquistii]|nr:hypothetical protein NX059_001878 [Plenodomus lindquistii]